MFNYFNKKESYKKIGIFFLFGCFFLVGIFSYRDYGISVDEWELRFLGYSNLKYLFNIFFESGVYKLDQIVQIPVLSDYLGTHGAIFALPIAFVEFIFEVDDSRNYYLLRHYSNHFIFLISVFYFFLLIKQRFNNYFYGMLGAFFLFLSPRIFAESFYNHKDVLFLSLFIINLFYGINFLKLPSLKNSIYFAVFTALSIDIRIMGIIIIPIFILATYFVNRHKYKNTNQSIILYIVLVVLITVLFWPYLWENPIINFISVFQTLSSFGHEGYNFYLGAYHLASSTPWHYLFVWIGITTPLLYLVLFLYGFLYITYEILLTGKENFNFLAFANDEDKVQDFIYYTLFLFSLLVVIFLNSTLYNGWRHLYFVYPCLLMISIRAYQIIEFKFFKRNTLVLNLIILILLSQICFKMYNSHPYQNVYFNILAGKKAHKNFEVDYWGLSNKQAFEYILNNENQKIINIGSGGPISLSNSLKILKKEERNRIKVSENISADFIIDNHINWHGKYKKQRHKIPKNFEVFNEIFVDQIKIVSIYKKIN